jgi:hypothetical protein
VNKVKKIVYAVILGALSFVTVPALAADKLTMQDYVEIQQLYAKYNLAIDSGEAEVWADTFTPDGVFNKRFAGREALIGFIKLWREKMNGATRRHWNSNMNLVATPEGATGSVYLMLMNVGTTPASVLSTGMYADVLVKTPAGWRFKSRVVNGDVPAPAPAATPAPAP